MHTVSQKLGSAAACVIGFSAVLRWKCVAKGDAPGWSSMTARRVDQTDMGTHGIPRFALYACLFAMIGCENRAKRTHPQAARDLVALQRHWDGEDLDAFVAHANQTHYLDDATGLAERLSQLRADVGAIRQKAEPLIDTKPADPRAYAVAHQVFACETGVLEFSVAYDTELRIVGFHVNGNAMPATPR